MRKLKFRAWIKPLQKLSPVNELYFDGGAFTCDYEYALESDAIELMQFTGLKDKNGVDIYEGDIVDHQGIGIGHIEYNEKHAAYNIVFKGTTRKWLIDMIEREIRGIEVVGNRYENPELLKQPKLHH